MRQRKRRHYSRFKALGPELWGHWRPFTRYYHKKHAMPYMTFWCKRVKK